MLKCFLPDTNSFEHEAFGIGVHQRAHIAGHRFVAPAVAQAVKTRVGAGRCGEQAILSSALVAVHEQYRGTARADRQRGDRAASLHGD